MSVIRINGRSIHYTDTLQGDVALVFSHGLLMDRSMFDAQVDALREHYRVITWDQRGHGQTGPNREPFSLWDSADDLAALLDHLDVPQAVLVGMSQGGYVSLRAALRYPEKVQALVLIATQAGLDAPGQQQLYAQLLDAWMNYALTDALAQTVAGFILGDDPALAAPWISKWKTLDTTTLALNFKALAERDDLLPQLTRLHQPALVIWGDADRAISQDNALQLKAGLAHSQFASVAGAAHAVSMTHAERVNADIRRFLSDAVT